MTASAAGFTGLLPACPPGVSWEPVLGGESGATVFRRTDGVVFAKCAGRSGVPDLRDERDRVSWLAATDVPCPHLAEWRQEDDGACLVTTAVDGIPACDLPASSVPTVLVSLAEMLSHLHSLPTETCLFDRTLSVTMSVVEDVVRRGAVNVDYLDPGMRSTPPRELLARLQAELARVTRLESSDLVVCHGDACLPNFLIDPETLHCTGVIDVGRLGVADRYLDLSLTTTSIGSVDMNPQFSADDADTFVQAYGLSHPDADRVRFYQLLDALSWG